MARKKYPRAKYPDDPADKSLEAARVWTRQKAPEPGGAECPCCRQAVNLKWRTIAPTMVWQLRSLLVYADRHGRDAYHDYKIFLPGPSGDFCKWKYWGFIEAAKTDDSKKKTSGMWRITEKGRAFLRGELTVPRRFKLYNDELVATDPKSFQSVDGWFESFDYTRFIKGEL